MADRPSDTEAELHQAMATVADLQRRLGKAYKSRDPAEVERLLAEVNAAERQRNRLMQRALAGTMPRYSATLPVREQVARVLNLLGRPAAVSLIRDVAAARFGDSIAGPRLASLRRDEHRSWTSATQGQGGQRAVSRPVYIVPGLTYDRMAPMRGVLALSSWPVAVRLVAPGSPRVDMLHVIDRLIEDVVASPDATWAPDVRRLLWRLGRTVHGGEGSDLARLRKAAAAELALLQEKDAAERASAARRATRQLTAEQLLFGTGFGEITIGGRRGAPQ